MSLSLHQTVIYKASLNSLQLNYVADQHYLSIFSLLALTLNNKLPQETEECFCVVFISMGDPGPALDHRVKLWWPGTCVMNSRPSDTRSWGYFINPEAQCSSRGKASLLSSLRPPLKQTAKYSLPWNITAHSYHNSTLNTNTAMLYRASECGINRNTVCALETHYTAAVNLRKTS